MPDSARCLLDTDVLVHLFRGQPQVTARMERYQSEHGEFDLSAISYYELERGAETNQRKYQLWREFVTLCHVVELDQRIADTAAHLYKALAARGELIADADLLIAATAVTHGLTLVTHNTQHFSRVAGLQLEDWLQ
jgi:tRNA(fMet)-specific endonuclease VapC